MKYFERLRDLREDNDLSQTDVAKILNTTYQKISDYENGKIMMRIDKYMKLARYYNISLDYLTGMIETPKPLHEEYAVKFQNLSTKQRKLLEAYEKNPEHQKTIDKILDIK